MFSLHLHCYHTTQIFLVTQERPQHINHQRSHINKLIQQKSQSPPPNSNVPFKPPFECLWLKWQAILDVPFWFFNLDLSHKLRRPVFIYHTQGTQVRGFAACRELNSTTVEPVGPLEHFFSSLLFCLLSLLLSNKGKSSIDPFASADPCSGSWEPVPAVLGREPGYTPDRSSICCRSKG